MHFLALLGASWLVKKCEGDVREAAYRHISYLSAGLLIFLIAVFIYSLAEHLEVMDMWVERPYLFVFPMIGAMAVVLLAFSVAAKTVEAVALEILNAEVQWLASTRATTVIGLKLKASYASTESKLADSVVEDILQL
jgi:cytochrome bd-type quinol oxidase subunit 2